MRFGFAKLEKLRRCPSLCISTKFEQGVRLNLSQTHNLQLHPNDTQRLPKRSRPRCSPRCRWGRARAESCDPITSGHQAGALAFGAALEVFQQRSQGSKWTLSPLAQYANVTTAHNQRAGALAVVHASDAVLHYSQQCHQGIAGILTLPVNTLSTARRGRPRCRPS